MGSDHPQALTGKTVALCWSSTGDLGLLIASVVVFLIYLFLALLFWPDQ